MVWHVLLNDCLLLTTCCTSKKKQPKQNRKRPTLGQDVQRNVSSSELLGYLETWAGPVAVGAHFLRI